MTTLIILALALIAMLVVALTAARALGEHLYEMTDEDLWINSHLAIKAGDRDNMYSRELARRGLINGIY